MTDEAKKTHALPEDSPALWLGWFQGEIRELRGEVGKTNDRIDNLDAKMGDRIERLEAKMTDRIDRLDVSLRSEMSGLRGEVKSELTGVRSEMAELRGEIRGLIRWSVSTIAAVVVGFAGVIATIAAVR